MRSVHEILHSARIHRRINTALLVASILMLSVGLWIGFSNNKAIKRIALTATVTATNNANAIAQIKANQDAYRQQYLTYIQDMITAMNKLQEDNRSIGLKVPKAPVPRPSDTDISETDLRRLPQTGPRPTPITKTETKKVYIRIKPKRTPSPKPWYKFFDSTR